MVKVRNAQKKLKKELCRVVRVKAGHGQKDPAYLCR